MNLMDTLSLYIYQLLLLVLVLGVKLLGGNRSLVHLMPEIGDIGNDKRNDERYYGHRA